MHVSIRSFLALAVLAALAALPFGCSKRVESSVSESPVASAEPIDESALPKRLDWAWDFAATKRHLNTNDHAAWQVVHGLLLYGKDFQIRHDGKLVGALDYLLAGGTLKGWNLRKGDHGIVSLVEAGTKTGQGHEDQWLGYLSQCGLERTAKLVVAGENYTVDDLIKQAQWDLHDGQDGTWTLMALATYLPMDAKWTAKDGSQWDIPRIVAMETAASTDGAPCGGTHRLYALAIARNRHLKEGGTLTGPWAAADKKIRDSVKKVREFQQPDGSFSTNFFERPATSSDITLRINTTGHALEFLSVALSDDELKAPWVTRGVDQMLHLLEETQDFPVECGSLYHAVHALTIYRDRRFGPRSDSASGPPVAAAGRATEPTAK